MQKVWIHIRPEETFVGPDMDPDCGIPESFFEFLKISADNKLFEKLPGRQSVDIDSSVPQQNMENLSFTN